MNKNEKIPGPKELEKEIGEFLSKKFGDNVKIISPIVLPQEAVSESDEGDRKKKKKKKINFNLLPEELVSYLDQYIVKQNKAKAVLATKICTHFNRIKRQEAFPEDGKDMVGHIKSNVLMVGPTGVGKTYMVKLIAGKIGVPFIKGDATKFSETGYVGGDVEDLVRDLVGEADGDIELAQYGIIYIDEIDKIASSHNMIGPDVSRTGVQRALLKPMEETDVEMKVPHDPVSMLQEIEEYRKSGKREKKVINTRNILFIMSGAFGDLTRIIKKRLTSQPIGFGSQLNSFQEEFDILKCLKSEDLIEFGFESEFVGRLPIRSVFERLTEEDLFTILKNPNNPIILGKKLDFAAYGIDIKFADEALHVLAKRAFDENTGARGLVSAIEDALLSFEKRLPSTTVKKFPVTLSVISHPKDALDRLLDSSGNNGINEDFEYLAEKERDFVREYITLNRKILEQKHNLTLSSTRVGIIAAYYGSHIANIENAIKKVRYYYDEVKKIELYFYNNHDINIVLEDDAIDYISEQILVSAIDDVSKAYEKLSGDFLYGLKLARDKTGKNRFFISKEALSDPDSYIRSIITHKEKASHNADNPIESLDEKDSH